MHSLQNLSKNKNSRNPLENWEKWPKFYFWHPVTLNLRQNLDYPNFWKNKTFFLPDVGGVFSETNVKSRENVEKSKIFQIGDQKFGFTPDNGFGKKTFLKLPKNWSYAAWRLTNRNQIRWLPSVLDDKTISGLRI